MNQLNKIIDKNRSERDVLVLQGALDNHSGSYRAGDWRPGMAKTGRAPDTEGKADNHSIPIDNGL